MVTFRGLAEEKAVPQSLSCEFRRVPITVDPLSGTAYDKRYRLNIKPKRGKLVEFERRFPITEQLAAMLFKLYCLPGKVLAHLNWLFPDSHMDAVRSARQRDSSLVHFLGSSSLYALIALFIWMAKRPDAAPPSEAVSEDEQVAEIDTDPQELMPVIADVVGEPEDDPPVHSLSELAAINDDQGIAKEAQFSPFTPDESHALSAAISEALTSGETTRWEDQNQAGYVVVSTADPTTSCRNYFYTIDNMEPNWQSPTVKTCD